MTERVDVIMQFLSAAGWGNAQRGPLAGDASPRRYERVRLPNGRRAVLMDAPPDTGEDIRPFVRIARWLTHEGYSPPGILAEDARAGLLLLEDLGDDLFARVCRTSPEQEAPLYQAAVDLLADLSRRPPPPDLADYSDAVYEREAALLTGWYLPAAIGQTVSRSLDTEFRQLVRTACLALPLPRKVCVLRDYHAENLIWLPDRTGNARVGLLDFQDALAGHPAYDLVSLLEDARRDTSADLRIDLTRQFARATGADQDEVTQAVATLGAQRNLKIVGIFARLWLRDGKSAYLPMIPRVWAHLMRDLAHPSLADLRGFVRSHVPAPTEDILSRLRGART